MSRGFYPRGFKKPACPVEGCTTTWANQEACDRHAAEPHVRCICGWAGVGIKHHLAAMVKRGEGGRHDPERQPNALHDGSAGANGR